MFILRRITEEKVEQNIYLDLEYTLLLKDKNKKEFEDWTKQWTEEDLIDVYGIVCFEDSNSAVPLYLKNTYYIMTGEGKTFSNITYK